MKTETTLDAVQALLTQGKTHWDAGNPNDALRAYDAALSTLEADAACKAINRVIVGQNLAVAQFECGHLDAAQTLVDRLIAYDATDGFPDLGLDLLRLRAAILEKRSDLTGAAEQLAAIRPDDTASADHHLKWNNAAGILAWRRGLVSDALTHFRDAVAALPKIDQDASLVAAVLSNAAILNYEVGALETAHALFERMTELVAETGTIASRRGSIRLKALRAELARDNARAAQIWEDGAEMIRQRSPDEHGHQLEFSALAAELWSREGKVEHAIDLLMAARDRVPEDWRSQIGIPDILLADLLLTNGGSKRAKRLLLTVAEREAGRDDIETQAVLFAALTRLASRAGQDDAAVLFGKLALLGKLRLGSVLSGDQSAPLKGTLETGLNHLKDVLHRSGRHAEAARVQQIAEGHGRGPQTGAAPLLAYVRSEAVLTPAEEAAAAGWLDLSPCNETSGTRAAVRTLLGFRNGTAHPDMPAPGGAPGDGVVRVQYVTGSDTIAIYAQRDEEVFSHTVAEDPATVFSMVGSLRTSLTDSRSWIRPARALHDLLIAPMTPLLKSATRLQLMTGSGLADLPFACLLGPVEFLCETLSLERVVVHGAAATSARPMKLAAFSGKGATRDFARADLDSLLRVIPDAACFHEKESNLQTFKALLADDLTHLHFSGHFDLDPVRPELSRLTFGNGEDLYLGDLMSGEFNLSGVEFACFSACNSGAAGNTTSGPSGLANVVLEQGTRHVLATHWPVLDTEASRLIAAFYARLVAGAGTGPAEALHQVQARAARATRISLTSENADTVGGIGSGIMAISPAIWAGFSLFSRI